MLLAKNRKALYNYEVIEKYMAGIVLRGYEVKAAREGKADLTGSYVRLDDGEAFVIGMRIGKYSKLSQEISDSQLTRDRKLLLNAEELYKLSKALNEKGKSAVPLALLLKNNLVKVEIAVVKGKKAHQKKAVEKEKQQQKETQKAFKEMQKSRF